MTQVQLFVGLGGGAQVDRDSRCVRPSGGAGGSARAFIATAFHGRSLLLVASIAASVLLGTAPSRAGCNSGNVASTDLLNSANCEATATGASATAVGQNASALGANSTSVGAGAGVSAVGIVGTTNIGAGAGSFFTALYSTSIGAGANSAIAPQAGGYSVAIGGGDGSANGADILNGARATGQLSVAVGVGSVASDNFSVASGAFANASGPQNTAIGSFTSATQFGSTAIGTAAAATGNRSTALGNFSTASGDLAVAIGDTVRATGTNATAIGSNSSATFANSTAIGNGATATAANQMSLGTVSNTYRMSGITSAASLAAQTGPVSFVTTDASGHLAATNLTIPDISGLQSQVASLQSQVSSNQREARSGTALALAATGLQYDQRPGKASVAGAVANYKGQSGLAIGFGYAVSERWRVNAAFTSAPQVSDFGVVAGASFTLN
jgi:autotransporter adhesin